MGACSLGGSRLTSWPILSEYTSPHPLPVLGEISKVHAFLVTVPLTNSNCKRWNWVVPVLEFLSVSSVKLHLSVFEVKCFCGAKFSQAAESSLPSATGPGDSPRPGWGGPCQMSASSCLCPWHLPLFLDGLHCLGERALPQYRDSIQEQLHLSLPSIK